jgi:hypothetical protein
MVGLAVFSLEDVDCDLVMRCCLSFAIGENLVQKWQVLKEVLSCSEKLVCRLGQLGSVSEAKAFCLEALKFTTKLQIPCQ